MGFRPHNTDRPRHSPDYDLNYGIHELIRREDGPNRVVYVRSPLINYVLGGAGVGITSGAAFALIELESWFFDIPWWKQTLFGALGLGAASLGVAMLAFGLMFRGKLVIDVRRRELQFFYWWFARRPRHVLRFDEIRCLGSRTLTSASVDSDSVPWTYDILVAELNDGRLVSIAVDAKFGDVRRSIEKAMERSVASRIPAEPAAAGTGEPVGS